MTEHNHNPTNSGLLVKWHCNRFFGEFQTTDHRHQQKKLKLTCLLGMGWIQIHFEWWQKVYPLKKSLLYNVFQKFMFFTSDVSVFIQLVVTIWRGWRCWRRISGVVESLSVFFSGFVISAKSIGHSWWAMIYCCWYWNYDILLKILEIVRFKKIEYFDRCQKLFFW